MKRATAVVVGVAVAAGVAGVLAGAAVVILDDSRAASPTSVRNTRSPGEVSSYWTEERKQNASPG